MNNKTTIVKGGEVLNSVAMLQLVQSMPERSGKVDTKMDEKGVFQNLLTKNTQGTSEKMQDAESPLFNLEDFPEELGNLLEDDANLEAVLLEAINLINAGDVSAITEMNIELEAIPEELMIFINQLLASKTDSIESKTEQNTMGSHFVNMYLSNASAVPQSEEGIPKTMEFTGAVEKTRFQSIISEVHAIFSKLNSKDDIQKAAPKILELLQQWQNLVKSSNTSTSQLQQSIETNRQELEVWKQVLGAFQKREQLAGKQLYQTDSKVTVIDVTKWVTKALETDKITNSIGNFNTSMPMSKLEQYSIYINQNGNTKSADQQLMDQFQKIIHSSKLTTMPNGTNQLSIALRPDNLGEMMVRFTQINGEMAVKIMVTSTAAKEMLESNIHQLKNMFSPHQVVIEKQDMITQSANVQKEQDENHYHDQTKQQSSDSDPSEQQKSEDSFELDFQELLMNEKV